MRMTDNRNSACESPSAPLHQPIAVIGIGCRFPGGVSDPSGFWKNLDEGVDAVTEVPSERWNQSAFFDPLDKPGKTTSRWGGFLQDIDQFDAHFFGISPREAARMDPQQRLLLETAWEALEDGGQVLERWSGSKTAVFVGISNWDYSLLLRNSRDRGVINAYTSTGGSLSIAANRISYCFDFRGPSAAVDTACSSALVAVHLACRSIWEEGCPLALAGGVNAILSPDATIGFSRLNVLSPDGRCRAFDAGANGYVRGEGAGMVLLKPLDQAIADGDRVYAVIRGTAMNQDGRTPGMTVPSQEAQERLLLQACQNAGIEPGQIAFVEAHGTGTAVGDPIEAKALGTVLSRGRETSQPCLIGSVKTNIGHLESAAGIAGLIKVALALKHRRIPRNLHLDRPNPAIDFARLGLRVPVHSEPWPETDGPAIAGVNSFGYGGTNAHVILQEPDAGRGRGARGEGRGRSEQCLPTVLPLSARGPEALRAAAETMLSFLSTCPDDVPLNDLAAQAALRRTHHDHRLAIVARTKENLAEHLGAFIDGKPLAGDASGKVTDTARPAIAFVCSGQGPQWWAMGRQLFEQEPIFRQMIQRCDALIRQLGSWSLLDEFRASEANSRMHVTAIAQPALFALQVGLAELWRSWGVRPQATVGHSVGEVAAAHLAGIFSLEDAVRIIFERGRCMELASAHGRMLAAAITPDEARELLAPYGRHLSLAAINSPSLVTLSGDPAPLKEIAGRLQERGVFCRFLQVQYAFHSAQMDPIRNELVASLQGIQPGRATIPFFSTVFGRRVDGPELGPEYWWHNVRKTVQFADAVNGLVDTDCAIVLELGPHPVLATAVNECFQARGKKVTTLISLKRQENERETMLGSLGRLYAAGYPLDWAGVCPGAHKFVELPLYPWQREHCWFESEESRTSRLTGPSHPLLGKTSGGPRPTWDVRVEIPLFPYLADHRVQHAVIFPAAGYLEMAYAVAREIYGQVPCQIEDVTLEQPCYLFADKPLRLQTSHDPDTAAVQIHSRDAQGEQDWTLHFRAVIRGVPDIEPSPLNKPDLDNTGRAFSHEECYAFLHKLGLNYGPAFQGIERGWQGDNEALGCIARADQAKLEDGYHFHPALLDACFQVAVSADQNFPSEPGGLYLPVGADHIRILRPAGSRLWSHARLREHNAASLVADIDIFDERGSLIAEVRGLRSQRVAGDRQKSLGDLLYAYQWQLARLATDSNTKRSAPGAWLIFADQRGVGEALTKKLRAEGERCTLINDAKETSEVLKPSEVWKGVIHLWNLDAPPSEELTSENLETAQESGLLSVLQLVQTWDKVCGDRTARLFLVTCGAQSVSSETEAVAVAQSPVIGLGRVIANEYPRLRCKLIDLDPTSDTASSVCQLTDELLAADDEDEIAFRGPNRYVHRYAKFIPKDPADDPAPQGSPYRLELNRSGSVEGLAWRMFARQTPRAGKVEIQVRTAGLNFSDVLKVLGLYPGLADGPVPLGAECSGVVTAVGEGVADLKIGDEVLAVAPFAFASHVHTRAELVVLKPPALSFEEAATLPIAFLTASYAMEYLGRLRQGERVLIHSASGGVGLAAIQLARRVGAEILATAGTPEKRDFLKSLGIAHVMDSRTLIFADQVLENTAGRGVDMILNSLAGEAIPRGLAALADHGRFLEIGKRDIYQNSRLGLKPFQRNLSFFAIDLDRVMRDRPQLLGELLRNIVQDVGAGRLQPLPSQVFPVADIHGAFRSMQQGKHIGKIVLSMTEQPAAVTRGPDQPLSFRSDATYLITGGMGGFGLAVARWLVERGARHLVLMGRRGGTAPEIAELERRGATVTVIAGDVASAEDVAAIFATIDRSHPPLRGVFHAAMILEDGLLVDLDRDRMQRVLAPKVHGSWNLHVQTRDRELDHFVLFSSLSSVFGHAGQGNYAAANAFLDGLAHYRRARGLPALTVNWGYLGDVGYLAQRKSLGERLQRQGVQSFGVREALGLLELALQRQLVQVSVMRVDWSKWRGLGVTGKVSPRFAHLCREANTSSVSDQSMPQILRQVDSQERKRLLQTSLGDKLARTLGVDAERIDPDKPLLKLGLDSLMAVEVRNWIENELHLSLPIVEVMRSPGLTNLIDLLLEELSADNRVGCVDGSRQSAAAPALPTATAECRLFPLSYGQRGLWFLYQLDRASTAYHVRLAVRIRSDLDLPAYERDLEALMARHPCLRTTFEERNGELVQRVHERLPVPLEVIDACAWTEEELRDRIETHDVSFDLEHGPLFKLTLFRLGSTDQVILVAAHHIVGDLWSLVLILEEMRARYPTNRMVESEQGHQYRDFVRWQAELLAGPEGEKLWSYWKDQLAGVPPVLDLPADRPRPGRFEHRGNDVAIHLDAELTSSLKALAAQEQVTLYTVLLAAFQAVLFKTTGQDDFVVGSPFSGRSRPEFERIVGYFINMLPLRADLGGNPSFRALLRRVGTTVLGALQHQDYPFPLLVERLGIERDPARTPLVQATFTLEKPHRPIAEASLFGTGTRGQAPFSASVSHLQLPKKVPDPLPNEVEHMHIEPFSIRHRTCQCDLEMIVEEGDRTIEGVLIYNVDLFDADTGVRLVEHFRQLLESAAADPDKALSALNWFAEAERRQVVFNFNQVSARPSSVSGVCLHQLVEQQSRRTPHALAMTFRGQSYSYADLESWSNRLARALQGWHTGAGNLVALCLERSPAMVAAILGVLKAGAAYVPLDPESPTTRLRQILEDTRPTALITNQHLLDRLPTLDAKVLCIDRASDLPEANGKPKKAATPGDLAYVIHTSGSTGRPKGVMIEHRAICNTIRWRQKAMPLCETDRVLLAMPYVFDPSVCTIFSTLAAGACLVLAEPGAERDPAQVLATMRREQVTVLQLTPSILQLLLASNVPDAWQHVRWVCSGGEAMPSQLPPLLFESMRGELFNLYGPTEAAVEVTCWQCRPGDDRPVVPIGRPIDNAQVYVLDSFGEPVPIGVPGEIVIGGVGLARGYWNDPALTAKRFVQGGSLGAGLAHCPSERFYRTGDRGRWLADGTVEFLGRLDRQVKVRGYRIELGEIEAALVSHPAIREAAVLLHGRTPDEQHLAAYVVANQQKNGTNGNGHSLKHLRSYLKDKLPQYMMPSAIVSLASIPRTATGKVNRFALPLPAWEDVNRHYVPPEKPLEELLARLWKDILRVDRIGALDNFFELGGTSLQAAIVIKRLQDELGHHVPTVALFDAPSIRDLAASLTSKSPEDQSIAVCLQAHGAGAPLFMIHPPGGIVSCYQALAQHLNCDRPFYGIRARGLPHGPAKEASLEDTAADYLRAIRAIQPHGPYFLGGWSLGGVLALEIAQQILTQDEEVAFLAFLDTTVPSGPDADTSGQEYGLDLSLEELGDLGPDEQLPYLWQHVRKLGLIDQSAPAEVVEQILTDLKRLFHAHVEMAISYRRRPYAGRITLFRPTESPVKVGTQLDRGWGKLAAKVDVHFVPGQHHSMLKEPHVQSLAQTLRSCLQSIKDSQVLHPA